MCNQSIFLNDVHELSRLNPFARKVKNEKRSLNDSPLSFCCDLMISSRRIKTILVEISSVRGFATSSSKVPPSTKSHWWKLLRAAWQTSVKFRLESSSARTSLQSRKNWKTATWYRSCKPFFLRHLRRRQNELQWHCNSALLLLSFQVSLILVIMIDPTLIEHIILLRSIGMIPLRNHYWSGKIKYSWPPCTN